MIPYFDMNYYSKSQALISYLCAASMDEQPCNRQVPAAAAKGQIQLCANVGRRELRQLRGSMTRGLSTSLESFVFFHAWLRSAYSKFNILCHRKVFRVYKDRVRLVVAEPL